MTSNVGPSRPQSRRGLAHGSPKWRSSETAQSFLVSLTVILAAISMPSAAVALSIVVALLSQRLGLAIAVVVGFTAIPGAANPGIAVGGQAFSAFELVIALLAAKLLLRGSLSRSTRPALLLTACILLGCFVALLYSQPLAPLLADLRGPAMLLLAFCIGSCARDFVGTLWACFVGAVLTLWVSAGFVVVAMTTGLSITGRTEQAALYTYGDVGASTAVRFLTPATPLAVAVVCAVLVAMVQPRHRVPGLALAGVPAAFLIFSAFSRNHLLAFAAALTFALLVLPKTRITPLVTRVALAAAVGAALVAVLPSSPVTDTVRVQVEAYTTRVIDGLDPNTLSADASSRYREVENAALLQSIQQAPILGQGFGHSYKPPSGPLGSFEATRGTAYAHNFYLWLAVKTGIIGLILFLGAALPPLLRRRTQRSTTAVLAGGVAAGLLASSIVAPAPLASGSAVVLGLAMALSWTRQPAAPTPNANGRHPSQEALKVPPGDAARTYR